MREIKLTQGKVAIVDDDIYDKIVGFSWFAINYHGHFYAGRKSNGKVRLMHREILSPQDGMCVDHIDGNGLNNQISNLRECTVSQNAMNRNPFGASKYKGVWFSLDKRDAQNVKIKIRSGIRVGKKLLNLGTFPTEELAAKAYDDAAVKHHGEFAKLNFTRPVTAARKENDGVAELVDA